MCDQQFLVFKEVAETRNITLAAKRLHISQPSISLQIQNLENQYGTRFFERTNKGVTLTQTGKVFYEHICQVINIMQDALEEINALAQDQRATINLGATLTIGEYVMPNIISYLYSVRPDIDFKVKVANTEIIAQDMLEKNLHIGLIEGPVPNYKDLVVKNFWQDELVVVVSIKHPWAARSSISLSELPTQRMITREVGSGTRKVMELTLQEQGLDPLSLNITVELGSTQAIKQVVASGLGFTIISALTVKRECDQRILKTLRIKNSPVYRPLNMFTHAHAAQTKDERYLINLLGDRVLLNRLLSSDYCSREEPVAIN